VHSRSLWSPLGPNQAQRTKSNDEHTAVLGAESDAHVLLSRLGLSGPGMRAILIVCRSEEEGRMD
jgi:hypothetical protein